jgi:molybdate transport system regulatory protein
MPGATRSPRATEFRVAMRVKVWLEAGGEYAFGFGLTEMLQAVERTGSIKYAAADLEKSYRYVWGRIKQAEAVWGHKLVETQVGGTGPQRSFLTPLARHFRKRLPGRDAYA